MRDVLNGQITHRDKSLTGFSICCWRNSICLRLDMLLHTSPTAIYVKSERDLSHIELARSDNISSSSKARTYRVGEAHISTEEKNKSKNRSFFSFYSCSFLLVYGFGLSPLRLTGQMRCLHFCKVANSPIRTSPLIGVSVFYVYKRKKDF